MTITEGATSYVVLDEGPLDTLVAPPPSSVNRIQALAAALVFPDYKIVGLNASTNNPGTNTLNVGANLTIGGEIQKLTDGTSPSLTITATDTDYTLPSAGRILQSSMSTTYTATPFGNFRTFESFYNPSNVSYATDVPQGAPVPLSYSSPGLQPNSHGDNAAAVAVSGTGLYGLTNTTVINLSSSSASVIFGGSTVVLFPEPGTLGLVGLSATLVAARRRRARSA
jgi:hypothetical protein